MSCYTVTNLASWLRQGEMMDGLNGLTTTFPGWQKQLEFLASCTDANEVEDSLGRCLNIWYDDLDSIHVLFIIRCMENRLRTLRPKEVGETETVRTYNAFCDRKTQRKPKLVAPARKRPICILNNRSEKSQVCAQLRV